MRKHLITSILLSTIGTSITYAQNETTSALNGTVREGNTPINGATIEAIHLPSGTKYTTSSRNDGRYNLPNMRIGGPYQITVTYLGHTPNVKQVEKLALGQSSTLDIQMIANDRLLEEVVVVGTRQGKVFNSGRTGASQKYLTYSNTESTNTQPKFYRFRQADTSIFYAIRQSFICRKKQSREQLHH